MQGPGSRRYWVARAFDRSGGGRRAARVVEVYGPGFVVRGSLSVPPTLGPGRPYSSMLSRVLVLLFEQTLSPRVDDRFKFKVHRITQALFQPEVSWE